LVKAKRVSLEIISKNLALRTALEILFKKKCLGKPEDVVFLEALGTTKDCGGG